MVCAIGYGVVVILLPGSLAYSTVVLILLLPFSNSFAYAFRAFVRVCCEQSGENSILCGH